MVLLKSSSNKLLLEEKFMYLRKLLPLLLLLIISFPVLSQENDTIVVVTHDSFAVSEDILIQFEEETGITVNILRSGDAGQMVNQSVLSKNNPLGDVLFGVDNTFLSRALNADIFVPYESPALEFISDDLILDDEYHVTPVDFGDVCLNYDVAYFEDNALELPENLSDLAQPEYSDLLVVENPATSSPGLAFMLATVAEFGTDGDYTFLEYWDDLRKNGVLVVDGWTEAYYGEFSAPGRDTGTRPLVVSYASSPPAEVYFSDPMPEDAVTGAIVADNMCFRQIEFVGVLDGANNIEGAQKFVDFMVSKSFQDDMPLNMFVFPVLEEAELPDVFAEFALIPENPATVDYELIDENREEWIQSWTEVMLR
jgi:thiamine transport system substrate-binding protein